MYHLAILTMELGDASDFVVDGIQNLTLNDVSDEEIEAEELARRMYEVEVTQRNDNPPEILSNVIPDMNRINQMELTGMQPLACESNDHTNSWSGNIFQQDVVLGPIGFSSSSLDHRTSAVKQSLPLSMDHHVPTMGAGAMAEDSTYGHHMAGSGNSTSFSGDAHQIMDDPFHSDSADKFVGNSFEGLPLDFIGISSPIPDIEELLYDDDLMQYFEA